MANNDPANGKTTGDWQRLKRALALAAPKKWNIFLIIVLTIMVAVAGVVEPLIMKYIFDGLTGDIQAERLIRGIAFLLVLGLAKEIISSTSNWLTWRTRIGVHYSLLNVTVGRLHRLPIDFHRAQGTGAIMTKMERGIQGFVGAIADISFNVLPAIAYLALAIVAMVQLDWKMTLLVCIFAPMPALVATIAAPAQRGREGFLMNKWGKIYSRFNEVLSGIVTVRSFAMEDYEKSRFLEDVDEANSRVVKGVGYDSRVTAIQNSIVLLARVAAIAYGAFLITEDQITLGTLIAFLGFIGGLFGPVQNLTGVYKTFQIATVSLEHIFSILDKQDFLGDKPDAIDLPPLKGEVAFNHIYFKYPTGSKPIVDDFDLQVKPGESVAFVGPSGSGKSTLIALLQRFYDPVKGSITLDGYDLRNVKQKSLRKQVGVVLQDALLFNESIADNIRYGRKEATMDEVKEAAKAANAHDFIMELSEGYETVAGERGGRLSGGERQRIAIARAIVKDPPVLILDEASSAMDAEVEALVQEALNRLMEHRTTFIIAHRLNTVVNADRIIVLKHGKIIEEGTHRDLLHHDGYYASLVQKQTEGLLLPAD
ncbi:ABC transporter transmembrane domain-containing protein [Fulvivirga kasyanovii]|uniref:ABC transporter ATP-binding protein n=1 Tax=Fulvivirga kasyanovii TaxID=396812 RepID=A0ABW9RIV3_9BACT|nr:ABC transporter ATP-binding protein [Fulvivirga kasyanovii]MTI23979.1 ABC transporter ATP-binding protein [Fulvivirga kasyanovii]